MINKNVPAGTFPADVSAEPPTMAQQQADALGLLAESALHHGIEPGAPGERYQVVVHVDAPALTDPDAPGQSVLDDGVHVSAETSRRLACDATRVVMRHDPDGQVTEVGARTRTIPPLCGGRCTIATGLAVFRAVGAASAPPRCPTERQPDGQLRVWRPDGRPLPDVPSPAVVPADPVHALRARHDAQGLRVDARTSMPGWLGERLDVGYAIDVLHPLAV